MDSAKNHGAKFENGQNTPVYNLDSIQAVSNKMSIPIEIGTVIIERFDSVAIDLIFLPKTPYSHKISIVPGDTGQYIWFLTSETNDPVVRTNGKHYTAPDRDEEPGSFENFYTIGMATYRQSHPGFSVIGFEENIRDSSVSANKFAPKWVGLISLLKKNGNKYEIVKRFKYGWHYEGYVKKYDLFEYSPSVAKTQAAYDYHIKALRAYPEILK